MAAYNGIEFDSLEAAMEFAATHECYSPGLQYVHGVGVWGSEATVFPVYSPEGPTGKFMVYEIITPEALNGVSSR